jgi:hypothetical protein
MLPHVQIDPTVIRANQLRIHVASYRHIIRHERSRGASVSVAMEIELGVMFKT